MSFSSRPLPASVGRVVIETNLTLQHLPIPPPRLAGFWYLKIIFQPHTIPSSIFHGQEKLVF